MSKRRAGNAPDPDATMRALADFDAADPLGRKHPAVVQLPAVAPKVCPVCKLGWDRHKDALPPQPRPPAAPSSGRLKDQRR